MNPKIDRGTGELTLGDHKLSRKLNEGQFTGSELGATAKQIRSSGTRRYHETWHRIGPELELGLTLGFVPNGSLQRISAKFLKSAMRNVAWSKALEDEIKEFHDRWLEEQLRNPPYRFDWGRVISTIDQHWYSANIVIAYAKTK